MIEQKTIDIINEMYLASQNSKKIAGYTIVNKSDIESSIDRIYANLPVEVTEARKRNAETPDTFIYEELKDFEIFLDKAPFYFCGYIIVNVNELSEHLKNISDCLPNSMKYN